MNPRAKALLERDIRPPPYIKPEPFMDDEDSIPTAHSCMPALIATFLLISCAFASIAPMLSEHIKPMDADWKAMLQTLTVGAVAYFISSTRQSAIKTDAIANLKVKDSK